MKIKPLYDRVLVKRVEEKEQKRGNIIIPDTAREKPMEGKVVAVGAGRVDKEGKTTPMQVKKGDTVIFGKYSGTEIKIKGEDHLMMRESDILAIIA